VCSSDLLDNEGSLSSDIHLNNVEALNIGQHMYIYQGSWGQCLQALVYQSKC
jgi:hypothetical protein